MPSLEITTMIGCPLMCTYCPQDKLLKSYKDPVRVLPFDTFATAINKIPAHFEIVFSGYTEAWSNKNCTDMIEHALTKNRKISIFTTLQGMSEDDCDRIINLYKFYSRQFKQIWIHLPDALGNMIGWKSTETYHRVLDRIVKSIPTNLMTMDNKSRVDPGIKMLISPKWWYLHTRANNLNVERIKNQEFFDPPKYEFIVECTRDKDYTSNVLLPNGDLTLCCMDYGLKHVIGNILTQTYDEILNGKPLQKIKELNNQLGFSTETLCKSCNDGHCRTPWNDEEVKHRVLEIDPSFQI